ncbi:MAG TPA: hypothetical protein VJN43_13720 [Bryobacteraceae bacterium]|nr:hypothetical protein [Bryobacteraceae bacterium]
MKRSILILYVPIMALAATKPADAPDPYKELKFRQIGPFRGGRVVAVAGVESQPSVYYFGGTGGGVFKTTDSGIHWAPVTDSQVKTGSVGAIAVAPSDPNVLYIGMGEGCVRSNASHGDGVYKSTDAGRTWKNIGLRDTQQIGRIRVHPKNPDIVYVAALGHMSGPNDERGVFRSADGGKNWKKVLFKSNKAGAIDLILDPSNPDVLYASIWEIVRKPWTFESGGPDSGLYKSTDGGETWTEITRNPGLPKGIIGRIGIAVSPVNPERVWALVEAADGGVFRSDNGGKNWTRVYEEHKLTQRAWYYAHIYADPLKLDTVYVLNVGFFRSSDGGHKFDAIPTPHGDNHDLWIAPNDSERMIETNDGGANISSNGGKSWSTINNQPTAQFYRVALDNDFPYHIYGAQQDNSTVEIASRGNEGSITEREWHDVGGGESGWIAPDPRDSNIVYAGSYDGYLSRYDHRTGSSRNVTVWPDNPMGYGVEAMKYRFQWNFPLIFSPHDPTLLYAGGNVLVATHNEGQSWTPISPDLTRNDKSKQGPAGGPITKDNSGAEYYDTIFTIDESPVEKGVVWTGSDDGLVYVTRDGGKNWSHVTPKDLPEWIQINSVAASPHQKGAAYFAATMYKSDDFRPFLYKTSDYGKTWKKIVNGIANDDFTRVVREDPNRRGLLIAGAETHLYISYDDGENWRPFQLNLPAVPITDVAFQKREDDLVVATQGRAFYVLDDMPLVRQLDPHEFPSGDARPEARLFQPKAAYRIRGGFGFAGGGAGQNPPNGVVVHYWLKEKPKSDIALEFLDASGKLIKKFSSKEKPKEPPCPGAEPEEDDEEGPPARRGAAERAPSEAGMNHFVWDMRYPDAARFPCMILWAGSVRGPQIVPGKYQVRLTVDGKSETQSFTVKKDPRSPATPADFAKQLVLALQVRDKLSQTDEGVIRIRDVRSQLEKYETGENKSVAAAAREFSKKLTAVEQELYQTKNQASEDPLNFPIKLNNKLAALGGVVASSDVGPTAQSEMVYEDLASQANAQLARLDRLLKDDLAAFNKLVRDQNVPAVVPKPVKAE